MRRKPRIAFMKERITLSNGRREKNQVGS